MKYLFLFTLAISSSLIIRAQALDDIVINEDELDLLIFEALKNNKQLDIHQLDIEGIETQKKLLNSEHLGVFFISANLNEYSIKELGGVESSVPNFYPRYNIGLNLRMNHFTTISNNKKLLDQQRKSILVQSEEEERKLIEGVTKKYINYIQTKNILNIKKTMAQFSLIEYNAAEQKFSEGEYEIDKYSDSRNKYYVNKLAVIEATTQYYTAKTELEALVHRDLESLGIAD